MKTPAEIVEIQEAADYANELAKIRPTRAAKRRAHRIIARRLRNQVASARKRGIIPPNP